MEERTWTVILFIDDKSVEAVPSNWIQGDICHWPSLAPDKLLQAIRKCEPLNTCWPSHNVKIFRNATFDDYGKARAKARLAEDTSDLNTDTDQSKRKRVQKILSSSESDVSPSDVSVLPSPPKMKRFKCKENNELSKTGCQSHQKLDEIVELDYVSADCNNPPEKRRAISSCKTCSEKDKYFKTLTEQIHIVRGMVTDILSEVKLLKKDFRNRGVKEQEQTFWIKYSNINLPLNTDEELQNLEEILQNENDFELLVIEFSKIGGTNCYNFVKRVLSTAMTNEMALKYSWLGRKGKRIFSNMRLAKVIICAAERANITANRTDTETAIQVWLKRASDRRNSQLNKKT